MASPSVTANISFQLQGVPNAINGTFGPLTNPSFTGGILGQVQSTLASGFNQINIPAGTRYVLIVPPAGNLIALTFKGVTGDTGVPMDPINPMAYPLPSGSGQSFGITAANNVTAGPVNVTFFG
jgi:hypothetical protein